MGRDLHFHSHPSRVEHWRHLIEIAAITVAAAWAFYVFIYQEQIKPASEPPELQPTVTLEHAALPNGEEFAKIEFGVKNVGSRTIYVTGFILNAYGVRFGTKPSELVVPPAHGSARLDRTLPLTRTDLLYSYAHEYPPFGGTGYLNVQPGTDFSVALPFAVKPRAYDAINLQWIMCFTKFADRSWPVGIARQPDGAYTFAGTKSGQGYLCYTNDSNDFPL